MKWICCDINDIDDTEYEKAYREMTAPRRERVERMRGLDNKKCTLAGEIIAKKLLLEEYGIEKPKITIDQKGKPKTDGNVHFSISHCESIVVCAVDNETVGIDIERMRPIKYKLIKRVCTDTELQYVMGDRNGDALCERPDIITRFFEIWTAKEAYFKKLGIGITDFKSVDTMPIQKQFHTVKDYMICIV